MPKRDLISKFFLNEELRFIKSKATKPGFLWTVEKVRREFEICPRCACKCFSYAGKAISKVRELSVQGEVLFLEIHKHRYMCKTCKKPFTESVKGIYPRRRTTQRFRKSILKDCHNFVNLSQVYKQNGCSSGFVYEIFYEQIEVKLRERKNQRWPKVLGIDEHFFSRGKGFREFSTVFTDLGKKEFFEIALGKSKKSLFEQIKHIPGRENVNLVCIDLCGSYRSFVKEMFPNAKIIADKFHVIKLPIPELIRTRKEIHGHRQDLRTRRLLLYNRDRLDYYYKIEIDNYLRQHPKLDELYTIKERLSQLYRIKGKNRARFALQRLIEQLSYSTNEAMRRLMKTLKNWENEIIEYFEHRVTNAFTEVTNRFAKALRSRACGYRSFKNYRLALLSARTF